MPPHIIFILYLLQIGQLVVDGVKRCVNGDLTNKEAVDLPGVCFPYNTSTLSYTIPCDSLYTQNETFVYLSSLRTKDFEYYLSFFRDTELFFNLVPKRCINEARKVLCHYYLPTCGNTSVYEPPTAVCGDVCAYLRNLCPDEYEQLAGYFSVKAEWFVPYGLTMINCSNTADYIPSVQHCCTDLDIEIPCTQVNNSGYPVPDPKCVPSASNGETNIGAFLGIPFTLLIVTVVVISMIFISVSRKLWNRKQTERLTISLPSSRSQGSLRYHGGNSIDAAAPIDFEQQVLRGRVSSSYIRQMSEEKLLIPGRNLVLMDTIGQGEFGVVYRGKLSGWRAQMEQNLVAVKTLKGIYGASESSNIMEESLKMAKFNHPNVMRLIGICIDKGPSPYIIMPYMAYGSLLSYLKKRRPELTLANDDDKELVSVTQSKLLSLCLQIAKGMSYLAAHHFVHRDLATRNCMIDENFLLKVSDFGLSEDIYARNYFRQTSIQDSEGETPVKLPVRWMAVESLHDGIFTEKTDVWSFGVTMWEVFSLGKSPYPGVDPFTLIEFLDDGRRLSKPANAACSQEIYTLMCNCWTENAKERPQFSTLVSTISERLESIGGYLNFTPNWSATEQQHTPGYDHLMVADIHKQENVIHGYDHLNPTKIVSEQQCIQ